MSERAAKYAINAFVLVTAALVPISALLNTFPVTPTFYAGSALALVYLAANPRLLLAGRRESLEIARRGPMVPVALIAGAGLMIVGVAQAYFT